MKRKRKSGELIDWKMFLMMSCIGIGAMLGGQLGEVVLGPGSIGSMGCAGLGAIFGTFIYFGARRGL